MCVLFCSSFVCISAYANVYIKTTIIKQNTKLTLIAGVPSSQALPGFLITAPPSVCVPAVIGVLAMWISNQKKNRAGTGHSKSVRIKWDCPVMHEDVDALWSTVSLTAQAHRRSECMGGTVHSSPFLRYQCNHAPRFSVLPATSSGCRWKWKHFKWPDWLTRVGCAWESPMW